MIGFFKMEQKIQKFNCLEKLQEFSNFCNQIYNELVDIKKCEDECEFSGYSILLQNFLDMHDKYKLQKIEFLSVIVKKLRMFSFVYNNLFGSKDVTVPSLQELLKK